MITAAGGGRWRRRPWRARLGLARGPWRDDGQRQQWGVDSAIGLRKKEKDSHQVLIGWLRFVV
jgi:hypothetical protein